MPRIATFDEMKSYVNKKFNDSMLIMENSLSIENYKPYTFVSYSSKDINKLPYVLKILKNHGATPYIDKGDDRLPSPPSVETAEILKDTITKSKRMVVFVTTNSKDSNWIPWELGLGDGSKTNNHIAIFPSAEKSYDTEWLEQEYLGLYKRIVYGKLEKHEKEVWMVYDFQENTATELSKWLNE